MENQFHDNNQSTGVPLVPTKSTNLTSRFKNNPFRFRSGGGPGWPLWVGLGVVAALIVVIAGFFGVNASLDSKYAGKIEPGVSISGVYIGEMTREEAKTSLLKQLDGYISRPLELSFNDKQWKPSLEELGVTVNLEASLNQAQAFGKTGDFFKDARIFKIMSPETINLPIEIQMDESRLNRYLSEIAVFVKRDTVEPIVTLEPDGKITATEGKDGFNVDYEATLAALKKNLQTLVPTDENLLQVHSVPAVITQQEITEFKNSLTPLLSGPVTVSFKDKSWTFDQKQIVSQIKLNRNTDKTQPRHLSYTFDASYFEKYITGLAKDINQEPREPEVGWNGGKLSFTKPSQDGQYLSVARSMDNLNQAFVATEPEKRKTTLWVDLKPSVLSSDQPERLNLSVIGEGVSSYAGSAYERATNIKVGAGYLTGAVVKPHSVFSFLDAVGEISLKRGYVKGYAIMADQTVPDVGGGICQVSTTVFRAAFFAGLPVVERNAHVYRVGWYEELNEPVGFDAAVYQPGLDFKFENPTDNYMVVTSAVENGKLYVRILGTKVPGQQIELVPGAITNVTNPPPDRTEVDPELAPGQKKQVDSAHKGLNTSITRVIKVNGAEVKRDVYATRFQAWPNIFKVGPPKATPTPAKEPEATKQPPATVSPAAPTTPAAPAQTTAPPAKSTTPPPATTPPATPKDTPKP